MSKTKELFIIGATAASCAIGYAFYKNNENNQDQQKEKMKQSLIESTSSAMDMSGQDFKMIGPKTDDVVHYSRHPNVNDVGQDFKMVGPKTDDVGQDFKMIGPKTDDVGQDFKMIGPKTDDVGQDFKMIGPKTDDVGQDFKMIGPKTDSSVKRKETGSDRLHGPLRN